jgi:hypothetical protein
MMCIMSPYAALGQVVRTVEQLANMAEIRFNLPVLVC